MEEKEVENLKKGLVLGLELDVVLGLAIILM